jgi:group I intron endonuclease
MIGGLINNVKDSTKEKIIYKGFMGNEEKLYCVYKHTSPSEKVYIGMTCQEPPEKRWHNGNGYKNNQYFNSAIQKYGWDNFEHEIVFTALPKEEAANKEKELIAYYKSNNKLYGYNISSGGEGGAEGIPISDTERMRRSEHAKTYIGSKNPNYGNHKLAGENNPFFNKEHSEETKQLLSDLAKDRWKNEEYRQHMSNIHKDQNIGAENPRARITFQYDMDGNFIKAWECAKDASIALGICYTGITRCCRGGSQSSGGFIWRYKENEADKEDKRIN